MIDLSRGVLLTPPPKKVSPFGIVVAPRLPSVSKFHQGDPFTAEGDVVMDCGTEGCGWHAMGPRKEAKAAWQEHYRIYHGASREAGVVLLNNPTPGAFRAPLKPQGVDFVG